MSVAKIFKVLIIVVACVIIGALVLNVLLPNTTSALVNAVEDNIFNATGMKFNLNGDGHTGGTNTNQEYTDQNSGTVNNQTDKRDNNAGVTGWQ